MRLIILFTCIFLLSIFLTWLLPDPFPTYTERKMREELSDMNIGGDDDI
jgi:hypothetical protein